MTTGMLGWPTPHLQGSARMLVGLLAVAHARLDDAGTPPAVEAAASWEQWVASEPRVTDRLLGYAKSPAHFADDLVRLLAAAHARLDTLEVPPATDRVPHDVWCAGLD